MRTFDRPETRQLPSLRGVLRHAGLLCFVLCLACQERAAPAQGGSGAPAAPEPAPAAPKSPSEGTGDAAPSAGQGSTALVPPSPAEIEAAHALARPGDAQRDPRIWDVRPWSGRAGALVALSSKRVEEGSPLEALDTELALLERTGSGLALVAKTKLHVAGTVCNQRDEGMPPGDPPAVSLDLAPYALSDQETALGVRVSCTFSFPAGEGSETRLYLYRLQGDALIPVFDAVMDSSNVQRGPGDATESHSILVVTPERHEGLFDLIVRQKLVQGGVTTDRPSRTRAREQRYLFDGRRYRPAAAEPDKASAPGQVSADSPQGAGGPAYAQPSRPQRAAILDAVRPRVEEAYGERVEFFVRELQTNGRYAVAFLVPQRPGGRRFDQRTLEARKLDGWVFALLEQTGGVWRVLDISMLDGVSKLDAWPKEHPQIPPLVFEVVGVATNAETF